MVSPTPVLCAIIGMLAVWYGFVYTSPVSLVVGMFAIMYVVVALERVAQYCARIPIDD